MNETHTSAKPEITNPADSAPAADANLFAAEDVFTLPNLFDMSAADEGSAYE